MKEWKDLMSATDRPILYVLHRAVPITLLQQPLASNVEAVICFHKCHGDPFL